MLSAEACRRSKRLEVSLDGEPVDIQIVKSGHAFVNFPDNGDHENAYVDVYGAAGFEPILHIEWTRSLSRDQTADAFGYVNVSSQTSGSLQVGNCADDGFVSILTAREEGADFLLRDLRAGPPCQGQPVDGELAGCLRF